ncbi:MAG TPA: RNB domain-containing ribonuclease [Candidatus Cloacimonadota bacterium]|nr:RNB domain-containing ribonuclease [Candidatus Cloacimonadota bacterium]HPT72255.1 RNB domain-containing ribonuclease [Candidatus Cloacimonadota bacterium]
MQSYQNHIIEIFQEEELSLFFVDKIEKGQLHIVDRNGKRNRIPESRVVFLFDEITDSPNAPDTIDKIKHEIQSIAKDIDTELLWESIENFEHEYTIAELSQIYFQSPSLKEQAALFNSLREDSLLFKRKGLLFRPRKQQQIEEIKLQAERDREKKEKADRLNSFFRNILASPEKVVPDPYFIPFLQGMKTRLYHHKDDTPEQILHAIDPKRDLGNMVYEILLKTGLISDKENRFLVEAGIPEAFAEDCENEAKNIQDPLPNDNRKDLTYLETFSIDDESTEEVDDALSLEKIVNGYRLWIHIADVSSWITPNSLLDKEAQRRITSIYLETGVILMFPSVLSCDRMSLRENSKRTAMSLRIDCTDSGKIIDHEFMISNIMVKHRLSYDQVDALIRDGKNDTFTNQFKYLRELTEVWKMERINAGAIEINKPEFNLEVKNDDIFLKVYDRLSPSRKMVSECMVMFNRLAARLAVERDTPMIYKAQESSVEEQLQNLPQDKYDPLLTDQVMRQMRPSRLTTIPLPHSGLGVDAYTQLTSPLRRYADLILQRQITASLSLQEFPYKTEELFEQLASIEENERIIREVYQKSKQYWLIRYFEKYRREDIFIAMVISIGKGQTVVEILEFGYRVLISGSHQLQVGEVHQIKISKIDSNNSIMQFAIHK